MTILATDIRLLESERMTDTPDGGGRRTNRVIPDGVAGNVFPKVSRVDAVYGRVNLRKVYPHVNTSNRDTYAGAHLAITDAPDNARISVLAFAAESDYDTRTNARDFIEGYVVSGPKGRMTLYGRQLKNASAILTYQRPEEPLPEVGDVYCLSTEKEIDFEMVTTAFQYVRIAKVSHELRNFTDSTGDFAMRVLTLNMSGQLTGEFKGVETPSRFSDARPETLIRSTVVADAARYFGIQPLSAVAELGDLTINLASVYAPIVPTTSREVPVTMDSIAGARASMAVGAALTEPAITVPFPTTYPYTVRTTRPIMPGSLRLALDVSGTWGSGDDGAGNVVLDAGSSGFAGTVNYETGVLQLTPGFNGGSELTLTYTPAAEVSQAAHTRDIPITIATRGTIYTPILTPLPAPGTLTASYRAMGKWYVLRDDGTGALVGDDPSYGTGSVSYASGACNITIGALPDVGSSLVLAWGSPVHYEVRTSDHFDKVFQNFTLTNLPIKPGSVSLTFYANAVLKTVTDNGAGGLTGHAGGSVNYKTGAVSIEFTAVLNDFDGGVQADYMQTLVDPVQPDPVTPAATVDASGAGPVENSVSVVASTTTTLDVVTGAGGIVPGYVSGELACVNPITSYNTLDLDFKGTSDGKIVINDWSYFNTSASTEQYNVKPSDLGKVVGTINYATGVITMNGAGVTFTRRVWDTVTFPPSTWHEEDVVIVPVLDTTRSSPIRYTADSIVATGGGGPVTLPTAGLAMIDTPYVESFTTESTAPIRLDLTTTSTSKVVAGSVLFQLGGKTYFDRGGTLYVDFLQSGSATPAGSIDYTTGIATPKLWARGAAPALAVQACLVKFGDWTAVGAAFRTAGSPLRPAATSVQVTAEDGTLITVTTDASGNWVGAHARGAIEQTMGVANIEFGDMVLAAGNELEPWFDPLEVVGLNVWKPTPVQPQTLRYSTVVLSSVPLSAEILGLDPVRLPTDGRVPMVRVADVGVIHHTASYNAGTPAASSVITVGRTNLSALWLEDANKLKLAADKFTVDLVSGTATMAVGTPLAGYVPPIAAKHRIEEMVLVNDVQINGQIGIGAALTRDYPLGSMFSTALLFGDVFARVENLFDQQTWTEIWSDVRIGSQATGQYNDADYPIEVLNNGAVTERWRVQFTSSSAFQVIGENLGVIATGSTAADLSVTNPLNGLPYFVLRKNGWGAGWAAGVNLRFNTVSAAPPFWLARTVLPGATLEGDSFDAQMRGDVD